MNLFRVFDWDGASLGRAAGGPLWVARARQGSGRHDAPSKYGAWYCSRDAVSAIAECIQYLRGSRLEDDDFERATGTAKAIVALHVGDALDLIDLDDPSELVRRRLRPSRVATPQRPVTQRIAAAIFDEGAAGLHWWSALNADWRNVTLFYERAAPHVRLAAPPVRLSVQLPEVRSAAEHLGVNI